MELTEREKAIRAAAIMDTDGCIYINKPDYIVVCSVVGIQRKLHEWLMQEYGGSICTKQPSHRDGYNRQTIYEWRLAAKMSEDFLSEVLPFLLLKRPQAECALSLRELQGHEFRNAEVEAKRERWEQCYQRMRELNSGTS